MRRIVGVVVVALVALAALDVIVRWRPGHVDEGVRAVRVQIELLGTAYRTSGDGYELSTLGADARPGGRGDDADEVGRPEPWGDGARYRRPH